MINKAIFCRKWFCLCSCLTTGAAWASEGLNPGVRKPRYHSHGECMWLVCIHLPESSNLSLKKLEVQVGSEIQSVTTQQPVCLYNSMCYIKFSPPAERDSNRRVMPSWLQNCCAFDKGGPLAAAKKSKYKAHTSLNYEHLPSRKFYVKKALLFIQ
jgi:hypothetical protein